jgi:hypothetical protein
VQAPAAIVEAALVTPFSGVFHVYASLSHGITASIHRYVPICELLGYFTTLFQLRKFVNYVWVQILEVNIWMDVGETGCERVIWFAWHEIDFQRRYSVKGDKQSGYVKNGELHHLSKFCFIMKDRLYQIKISRSVQIHLSFRPIFRNPKLKLCWARGTLVGWGTMLQVGRSRVRVPMRWIFFFNLPNPAALWPWDRLNL